MKCSRCQQPFEDACDTWPSSTPGLSICTSCWEIETGDEWCGMMRSLEPTGVPDEYRRVGSGA